MSRRRSTPALLLAQWLMVWVTAFGLLLPTLYAFRASGETLHGLLLTGVFSLMVAVMSAFGRRGRFVATVLAVALAVLWFSIGNGKTLLSLFSSLFAGAPAETALAFHFDAALTFMALVFVLTAKLLVTAEPVLSAPLMVFMTLMLWYAGARDPIAIFLPAAASLALMLSYIDDSAAAPVRDTSAPRRFRLAVPVALLLALLALAATPARLTTVPELARQADRLRQYINDRFFFTGSREMFTLAREGYQPMGDKGLGGRPTTADVPVMEITSQSKVYLRGAILNLYDGRRWQDSISSERYGYHSFRHSALRDALMDARLPEGDGVERREVSIHMLREATSTLFTPQRIRKLTVGEGMVPWFNAASELFITRNLRPGDQYTIVYEPYVAGTEETDALAYAISGADRKQYDSLISVYTQLPVHLEPTGIIADLARRIVAGEEEPYRQALAIMEYLKRNYSYTLDVPDAPTDMDFTAHFLFELKKGYCTYFATAMTVLCRSLSLPSRYIEGFFAEGAEDGSPQTLTSLQAHAWTEVYISGLGWVTFDATAPSNEDGESDSPPDSPPDPPPGVPTPSPSPEPPSEDEPQEDQSTPSPSPSPPPEDVPEPSPSPIPESPPPDDSDKGGFPWWILIALAILVALVLRIRHENPDRKARRAGGATGGFMVYWQALLLLKRISGSLPQHSETLREYALRTEGKGSSLVRLADSAGAVLYGKHTATPEAAMEARWAYHSAYKTLPPHRKLRFLLEHTARGTVKDLSEAWSGLKGTLSGAFRQQIRPRAGRRRRR